MLNDLTIKFDDLYLEIYGFMQHGFVKGFPVIYNGEPYIVHDVYARNNPGDIGHRHPASLSDFRLAVRKERNGENIWVFARELQFHCGAVQKFIYQYEWEKDFEKRHLESISKMCDDQQGE